MEYLFLGLGWMLFYSSHTFLAMLNIKRKIRSQLKGLYKWYRLSYSLFSTLFFFALFLYAGSIPRIWLFGSGPVSTYLGFMLATFGTIISVKSMRNVSARRFIGLRPKDDLSETEPLVTEGWYGYMRHPLYAGLILIFIGYFLYAPNLSSLIHLSALLLYLPVGIYYEEKKLLEIHGNRYAAYQKEIPAIIPRIKK
ncbi:methyltransferase family protein [Cyclobacterium jeungdonense]|uniref:Isoprenylcysteine carboxylmethyltransferase family protein n=1 Tax=Cyclobacterium jeungdonense TaxID=708087 RepID=A0ABT8C5K5_9BACT|nr:isoprenylcysteine carboxylmethyltransferase family protein [Cyclobacterium jeungdonense]MDN3687591.1 isoprenylcysteine carboxylmethyltransferase family protein [Cyclobacterium jeungdonense]